MPTIVSASLEIAPCSDAEVPQLFGLAKSVFADSPGWSDGRVLEALDRDLLFVAREEGQPAGYVALRHEDDGGFVVEQLFIAPGHEEHGIGRRLLEHAEGYAIAEGAATLRIVVERDNEQARSFYRRAGFVPVGAEVFERVLPAPG